MAVWNSVLAQVTDGDQPSGLPDTGDIGSVAIKPETLNIVPQTYPLTALTGQLGLPCVTGGAKIITQISQAIYNWSTISGVTLSEQGGLNLLTGMVRGSLKCH